jgi:hypothetical protein
MGEGSSIENLTLLDIDTGGDELVEGVGEIKNLKVL